jgi:putative SOS response-associated peptidase YedK
MAPIHDRMPVVLPPNAWEGWLDRDNDDVPALAKLLVPAPASLVVPRPVSTDVNSVRVNDAHLIDRVDPAPVLGS